MAGFWLRGTSHTRQQTLSLLFLADDRDCSNDEIENNQCDSGEKQSDSNLIIETVPSLPVKFGAVILRRDVVEKGARTKNAEQEKEETRS
jgi:hypothetical protein